MACQGIPYLFNLFISFLNLSVHACVLASAVSDSVQPYELIAHQAPLSMRFSRQEYWSVLPCSPPGDPPNPGIKPASPALQADSLSRKPLNLSTST